MNIAISFIILSLFYSLFLNILNYQKKYIKSIETDLFLLMLSFNFLGLVLEILCYFTGLNNLDFIFQILNRGYLIYILTFACLFNIYALYLFYKMKNTTKEEEMNFYKKISKISYTALGIITPIVLLFPIKIHNTGQYIYSSGIGINIIFLVVGFLMTIWSFLTIKNIKKIFQKKYVPVIVFILLSIVTTLIQQQNPGLTFTTVMETFIVYIMYHTMENPDIQIIDLLTRNKQLMEESVNEKSNFLFKISQELKKPIKDITKQINMLKNTNPEEQKELIELIDNNAKNANFIINNITNVSSMDVKNTGLIEQTYNTKRLFKEIELTANNQINSLNKTGKLTFRIKENTKYPESVYGDKIKLKQVIMSIINNSIKYTDEGHIELEIDAIVRYDACRFILTITDTGRGMSISQVNKLLSQQEEITEEKLTENNDLNLPIPVVNKLLKIMGGNINITSKEKRGTIVTIVVNEEINYDSTELVLKEVGNYKGIAKKRSRVLLVDNENKLDKILKILTEKEIDVIKTLIGKDCVDKIKHNEQYDLIIIKDELETTSAYEILSKLKKIPKFKTPVVIAITKDKEFIKEHFLEEGFANYIVTDEEEKTMEKIIEKYL